MNGNEIRTRFAPSPTGYMHVGNLRTALFTYLIAKAGDGKFLLRIEDTDQERFVPGAVEIIYDTLRECGLDWDEGPDIGGPAAPYVQSERQHIHKDYAMQLVESGHAYRCFCQKERLEEVRLMQKASGMVPKYDGHCRNLSPQEIEQKLGEGVPFVVRQKVPLSGTTTFHDEVFGDISVENASLDDQVLIKTDGMATYNFANVVDDHLMGITHVVRGNEYLSSAPKYNLLYEAFGWPIPTYIHCSPVMKNSTEKLSKRNGDASYQDLIAKGYLTGAVLNYIALLGWSPKGDKEIFTLDELIQNFDVSGISKSPAIFDTQKLNYINGEYLKAMPLEEFHRHALPWVQKSVTRKDVDTLLIAQLLHSRTEVLEDIPEQVDFIDALPEYDIALFANKKMKTTPETALEVLREVLPVLQALEDYSVESVHSTLFALIEKLGCKNGYLLWPLRIAVSGKQFTPGGGVEICAILGKQDTLSRICTAIDKLS